MRSLTLLEPWHMLLRLVAPDDSTAWPLQELGLGVRFVVAPWCMHHKKWRDPATCARCLTAELEVGVRVGSRAVRRVHPLAEAAVCGAVSSVAGQIDAWIRRAWRAFGPPCVAAGDRRAARLLRGARDVPDLREVFGVAGDGDRRFETWSLPDDTGSSWEGLVARAYALNRVLARLGRGVHDSSRTFVARLAAEVAQRFGNQGSRLYPFVAECLDAVVDCALVIQMRIVGSPLIARRVNTAGTGFLWAEQVLMCPQASGAVHLVSPDQALEWVESTVNNPTGRTPSHPSLQTLRTWKEAAQSSGKVRIGNAYEHDRALPMLDLDALLLMQEERGDPQEDAESSALVEALRWVVKNRQPPPGKAPYTFRVGSSGELRGPQRGMGKRP